MKVFKKIAVILIAGILALTTLCVAVSADNILSAKTILPSGKKITINLNGYDPANYKIKVTEKGTIKFSYTIESNDFKFYLYDSDGAALAVNKISSKSGRVYTNYHDTEVCTQKNYSTGVGSGTIEYSVKKGTYYLMIKTSFYSAGKVKLTATYPSSDSSSSDAKIDSLSINVKKGAEISFGTMITGSADLSDIKWSTSDKKVATVSSNGTVKAVGKGKATITAKLGSSSVKIVVKVS